MRVLPRISPLLPLGLLGALACQGPTTQDNPQLLAGYGGYHRVVSGADDATQEWIDQGFHKL